MFDTEILPNKYKQCAWNYKGVMKLLEISWPTIVDKRCIKSWIPHKKAHVKSQNIILIETIKHHNIYLSCSNVSGVQVKPKHKLSKKVYSVVLWNIHREHDEKFEQFQDYISWFKYVFSLFECSGFMHLLCTMVGHDISNESSHYYSSAHIVLDLVGRISGSNRFALMFLTWFSLYFCYWYGSALSFK